MLQRRQWCAAMLAAVPVLSWGQGWPERQIKLVVGFAPGTGPDLVARTLGQRLGEQLRQSVVVDNRAGASGQLAAQGVSRSAADGYTLLLGEVGSISIAPASHGKLPYSPLRDLQPVSEVVRSDFLLVVPASAPVRDLKAFVAQARQQADKLNVGTFGAGTPGHFGAELLAEEAGFKVEPVHFGTTGEAVQGLLSGQVQAAFVTTALAAPHVRAGKLRALATSGTQRTPLMPDVPTFAEGGLPRVEFSSWFALLAPAQTPSPVMDHLNRSTVQVLQHPEVRRALAGAGFSVVGTSREDSERMLKAEAERWAAVVKTSGYRGD